jgi:hypothetical protein
VTGQDEPSYFISFRTLFNNAFQCKDYIASNDLEGDIPEFSGIEENKENLGVPPEIRTEHHQNTSLDEPALSFHAVS